MSKNVLTKMGYCDACTKRTFVSEIKLRNGRVIQLCESCLDRPYHQAKSARESFREGDQTGPDELVDISRDLENRT